MIHFRKAYVLLIISIIFTPMFLSAQKEIYIDLSLQRAYAIEDGKTILEGRISSGKSGYETPTGSFEILQKKRKHVSNKYPQPNGGAKMPYMMRLTWDGIAMHQGYVPKKPASHGCIRLQRRFAKKLFHWTKKGTMVTVAGDISHYYDEAGTDLYSKDADGYSIIEVY